MRGGYSGSFAAPPAHTNVRLYADDNPLDAPGFETKVKLLAEIDAYLRDKDPRVRQVSVSLGATWQVVEILRPDGSRVLSDDASGPVADGPEMGAAMARRLLAEAGPGFFA